MAAYVGVGYVAGKIAAVFSFDLTSWPSLIVWAIASLPALAVLVRRLHDLGHSGWWGIPPLLLIGPVGMLVSNLPLMESPSPLELLRFAVMLWLGTLPVIMLLSLIWTRKLGDPVSNRYGLPPT